jgi:hypothetical protein
MERERGQNGIEMSETRFEMGCPLEGVVLVDGEGVDSVKGLEVVEVRQQDSRGERAKSNDLHLSGVSQETLFAHVRQEVELIVGLPIHVVGSLFLGENAPVVVWSKT